MTEDIIERAKAIVERFQNGYESPSINPIILDLIAEIEHLREHTDWQHENALKWKEACDELEDEKNQWKGRYLELKEDREQEMSDEDKKEIIDLDAELTAKDIEIERLRSRLEELREEDLIEFEGKDSKRIAQIAAKDARIKELEASVSTWKATADMALSGNAKLVGGYVERLEAAFLEAKRGAIYFQDAPSTKMMLVDLWDKADKKAREALERIRSGKDD